jgi:hypothetical protein
VSFFAKRIKEMTISQLKIYSIGIVAKDKAVDSDEIEVLPVETFPMVNGELNTDVDIFKIKAVDSKNTPYEMEAPSSVSIKATYLPFADSNRLTSPDVTKGEAVVIYRFGDNTDKFYWVTRDNDMRFRRQETVVFGIRADTGTGEPSLENTYLLSFSSHDKRIRLTTTKALGEPFAYDLDISTKEGYIKFSDDIDNMFLLDSTQNKLRMENCDGSFYDITRNAITQNAADSVTTTTKAFIVECETYDIKAAESASLETPDNTIMAETLHEGNTKHVGNIALIGDLKGTKGGSGSGGGKAEFEGSMDVSEGISTPAVMHARKVISDENIEAPNVG